MYLKHFGFSDKPFRLTPDARYFFPSDQHRRALAFLEYGLHEGEGFILVTGEPGTGKSTLVSKLMAEHARDPLKLATIETASLAGEELLDHMIDQFQFQRPRDGGKAAALLTLRQGFLELAKRKRRALLIVDEAQNLTVAALEELRMLSNLLGPSGPLLQTFLVGQPDLARRLLRPEMEQLRQRVTASFHLAPFSREDCEQYVEHRLRCVGWTGTPAFAPDAFDAIERVSGGTPRLINVLCDRLMLYCYLEDETLIPPDVVLQVAEETGMVEPELPQPAAAAPGSAVPTAPEATAPASPPRPAAQANGAAAEADVSLASSLREVAEQLGRIESRIEQSELKLRLELARLRAVFESRADEQRIRG